MNLGPTAVLPSGLRDKTSLVLAFGLADKASETLDGLSPSDLRYTSEPPGRMTT